jgi:hypothetical protein
MTRRTLPWLLLPVLLAACSKPQAQPAAQPEPAGGVGVAAGAGDNAPAAAAAAPAEAPAAAPAAAAPAAAANAPAGAVLASQDTNWPGVVAEVTELRRKGNTLTAKVRLRNAGADEQQAEVHFDETYLMDAANAKKYEVLRDEKGVYVASLRSGWNDRWYGGLKPTQSYQLWMKFPAPPADVHTITLQLPNTPPFEDLAIQDG